MTQFNNSFSEEVWKATYNYKDEKNVDETFRRVAKGVASVEKTDELKREWEEKFYDMLSDFKVTAGGRIYANAGTDYKGTTNINCFLGPRPDSDIDSLDGIMEVLRMQAQTLKSEGGWGMNFSFIRPRGAHIYGIGVDTPGAVKYMEIFDKSSEIVTSGSGLKKSKKDGKNKIRKGAMMGVLDCWHPDIEEFITAKQTPGRLTKFNMSANCSTEFMDKVCKVSQLKNDGKDVPEELDKWDLVFPETTFAKYKKEWNGDIRTWKEKGYPIRIYKTVSAVGLWETIMQSTYNRNEPGVLFLDNANKTHAWNYGGPKAFIAATNPCVTGDTLVYTADGREFVPFKTLAEEGLDVSVFCSDKNGNVVIRTMRNPRKTGENQAIYSVTIEGGHSIRCTANHKFILRNGEEREAKDLRASDSLAILTRYETNVKSDITGKISHNKYRFITFLNRRKSEHKIVAENSNGQLRNNEVVHHIDYNSLNNSPENLIIMNSNEHDMLHRESKIGDKNPMRIAKKNWSKEQWEKYGKKMSSSVSGEKNGKYSGVSNKEIRMAAMALTKKLGRRFSSDEWREFAKENNLVEQFSKFRNEALEGGLLNLSKWAAKQCGLKHINCDPRLLKTLDKMKKQGYDAFIKNGVVFVNKVCEITGKKFSVPHLRREVSICSEASGIYSLLNKRNWDDEEYRNKVASGLNKFNQKRKNIIREKQASIYTELRFNLKRYPSKKEWASECKKKNISCEIARKSSPFRTYKDLITFSNEYNHRVISVKKMTHEDVYNGTVDEFHNYFIGGFDNGKMSINTSNCGEQSLPFSGACNLLSVNISQFFDLKSRKFDFEKLEKYVRIAVRFADNVNDYSNTPLPQYTESLRNRRRIGMGVLGWASLLYLMNVRFGSKEAETFKKKLMKTITHTAVKASIDLAIEKGMFADCDKEKHSKAFLWEMINLPQELVDQIKKHGIRNSALFSIQPTGNTAVFANNVSSGIEPIFGYEYIRTVIVPVVPDEIKDVCPKYWQGEMQETEMFKWASEGDDKILRGKDKNGTVYKIDKNRGLTKEVVVRDLAYDILVNENKWNPKADWACTALDLTAEDHVTDMMGWYQWIDSSISKTVNLPNEYPYEKFKNIYLDLYKSGIAKGMTTYRAGTMASVLSVKKDDEEGSDEKITKTTAPKRKKSMPCEVHFPTVHGKQYYAIVGLMGEDPYEVFTGLNEDGKGQLLVPKKIEKGVITKKSRTVYELTSEEYPDFSFILTNGHSDENADALTRMISTSLRHGADISFIVHQLEKTQGSLVSFSKVLARTLKKYIPDGTQVFGDKCPTCGASLIRMEGCIKCSSCDYSKCG